MNPEQFQQFLKANEEATGRAIEKYVNGGIRKIRDELNAHAENDAKFQESDLEFKKRLEPMVKIFEDNKVVEAVIENKTKKITFYIREVTTISVFLLAILGLIKFLIGLK